METLEPVVGIKAEREEGKSPLGRESVANMIVCPQVKSVVAKGKITDADRFGECRTKGFFDHRGR